MRRLTFATLCATIILTPVLAQEGEDAAKTEAKTKAAAQIKPADIDGDGVLTLAELRAARYELRKALIAAREDKAKTKELNEGSRGLPEFQVFLAADINNDMKLSADELANFALSESDNKRWRLTDNDLEMLAQETGQDRWEWAIARDANTDNHLTADEAGVKSEKDRKEFRDADLDKDGLLSGYEFQKYGIDRFKEKAKPKVEKARAEFKDAANPNDPFALYKKKGRTWMHKTTTTIQGMDPMVTYMKWEITDVNEDSATYRMYILDKDKKPMAGMEEGTENKLAFPKEMPEGNPSPDGGPKELGEETLEAAGRNWVCKVWEQASGGQTFKYWMSVEYPGLIIKMEGDTFAQELVEFSDGE